jgi:poly-gamma-glutamate synthesis protein (capsule biosynthesis protein)
MPLKTLSLSEYRSGPGRRSALHLGDFMSSSPFSAAAGRLRDNRLGLGFRDASGFLGLAVLAVATIIVPVSGPAFAQDKTLTITLAGQSMIRSDIRATAPEAVPVLQSLLTGDVKFTNLEATVVEKGEQGTWFLTPPEALDSLTRFGFNLLSLSSNHAFDFGVAGVENTLREADKRNIVHAGTGNTMAEASAPAYLATPNGTVALVASASGLIDDGARASERGPGVNELRIEAGGRLNEATDELPDGPANAPNREDAQRILQNIGAARTHADIVIVYQHNHVFGHRSFQALFEEGLPERLAPNAWLKQWTHAEIDAGADIVVMHGAPLLHGVEIYRGKPIFYDLGNFIYNLPPVMTAIAEPMSWESVVANLKFQGNQLKSITLRPITLNAIGRGQPDMQDVSANNQFLDTRGLPSPATGIKATDILRRVADASKPFGTEIVLHDGTAEIDLKGGH